MVLGAQKSVSLPATQPLGRHQGTPELHASGALWACGRMPPDASPSPCHSDITKGKEGHIGLCPPYAHHTETD